jgi:GntR family transcriptional regulator
VRYLEIADSLRGRIADGLVGALPSEAELGAEFGASRVTVRHALELLRDEGILASRRGSGWFVLADPVRQSLGRVTTIEAAVEAAGARAERQVLEFAYEPAPTRVAEDLGLTDDREVLRVLRRNLADGEPFAIVAVWVPGALGRHLSRADVERAPFLDLLPLQGVEPHRVVQTITADIADGTDAERLDVPAGSALLVCRRVTYDRTGRAVMLAEHRYPSHRTALEVEFPCRNPTGDTHAR